VLILSKEYVCSERSMAELRILLQRWQAGGAELVPVLYGISVAALQDIRQLYNQEAWCVAEEQPAAIVLDGWAADLQEMLCCNVTICMDQVQYVL
jgi:hypothetical protein